MLELIGVKKTFSGGTAALNSVDLKVQAGDFVVLLGPSGSGKTTLIRCINGMVSPDCGSIKFKEKSVLNSDNAFLSEQLGVVFQDFNLVENLSVLNYLPKIYLIRAWY